LEKGLGRLQVSRIDHDRKIKSRKQRADIGKDSFVNRPYSSGLSPANQVILGKGLGK
jgi:hypothetical protein